MVLYWRLCRSPFCVQSEPMQMMLEAPGSSDLMSNVWGGREATPPEKIRVFRTGLGRVDEVNFKAYVKDVIVPEWPPNPGIAAYEAGAMAAKTFAWFFVLHWPTTNTVPGWGCYHVDDGSTWTPGVYRNGTWFLNNSIPPSEPNAVFAYGDGNHTPISGKWQLPSSQGVAVGVFIVDQASGAIRWLLKFANTPGAPDLNFTWGTGRGRPIAGDYISDALSTFGPGFVSDEPADPCSNPNPDQGWNLKYSPNGGGIDVQYRYERLRP